MRIIKLLFIDIFIIMMAILISLVLRDNFESSYERILGLSPYLLATVVSSALVLPLFGLNRSIWRFSSLPDYLRLTTAMVAVIACSVAITFAFNRLDDVPRSLPLIQFNISITLLIGLRVLYRLHHMARRTRRASMTPLKIVEQGGIETVLLVGLSRLTETYLQSVAELAADGVNIAGILGSKRRHVGRLVATHPVLGMPEDISQVVTDLQLRGVVVNKILVTSSLASLSDLALKTIASIERAGLIEVIYLSEKLGFETRSTRTIGLKNSLAFDINLAELEVMQKQRYWSIKRIVDVLAATILVLITSPFVFLIIALLLLAAGRPLIFWQQRPGLGGRPFRLYKFRTMGAAYTVDGRALSDDERMSGIGNFLRRTRLDELPQLLNIIRGDMSFVGPRPLLPRDQDNAYRARLLVRPGLTGWAQVVGGRAISAEDKAALDVWYVRNASSSLDAKVIIKTVPLVLFGETISRQLIENAWRDLQNAGVLRGRFVEQQIHDRAAA
jgi:lipopolysaccharide/colanic/teichoic acid biosynthesis glycosyltransferase